MQNKLQKLFTFFFIIYLNGVSYGAPGQHDLLLQADQLFAKKKYTEAFNVYNGLFTNYRKFTPQTLLKMAFIKEGLGEYPEALYYLNIFYENYPDKKIFNKMKDIAEREKLEGYIYSDLEFFSNLYRTYHDEIIFGLMGLVFLYFLAVVTNKIFIKGISTSSPYFFIVFLAGVFYATNFGEQIIAPSKGVILNENPLLMEAPSPGAKALGTLTKGTRVTITDETDIWYEIKLNDKKGFIRKFNFGKII